MEDHKYKVIVTDYKGKVKDEEVKRVIDLLKDESSDHLSILQDLTIFLRESLFFNFKRKKRAAYFRSNKTFFIKDYNLVFFFWGCNFFSSTIKIFIDEKDCDEKIINLLVIIINKIYCKDFDNEEKDLYKLKDAIDPLFNIMKMYSDIETKEDCMNAIIMIARKYPLDMINNNNIKTSYKIILPSNRKYYSEDKMYVYILFKETIKDEIIKKGEEGSEIIEKILFIGEMINKKKEIMNIKEELMNEINNYVMVAKEKGFTGNFFDNKNDIVAESVYIDWIEMCEEDNNRYSNKEEGIAEEEKEEIRKFCNYVSHLSFDIQIQFVYDLYDIIDFYKTSYPYELKYFKSRKNGLFLYLYLPFLFKIYHYEKIFPEFFWKIQHRGNYIPQCYEYVTKLYNEIIERMMEESKEIETNEENTIIILFLWSLKIEKRKNDEVEYLINTTMKILEWLGRIEEEKEEAIKEKEKEIVKKKDRNEERRKENVNKKEIIVYSFLNIIILNISYSKEIKERMKKDRRISRILLEIIKNHLKNERCLIEKGIKKKIIEYIIYSYYKPDKYSYNEDIDTSNLLSLPSHSFPFSHNTISNILYYIYIYFMDGTNYELLKKDLFLNAICLLNNVLDLIKILYKCDIKKEIEEEILIEWNNNIINDLYKKISFDWKDIKNILSSYLNSSKLSSFDNKVFNIILGTVTAIFIHNNNICNNKNLKEKNIEAMKERISVKPFIMDEKNRKDFITCFLSLFFNDCYYSILDVYYLMNKSEVGYNFVSIYLRTLSGEVVDRIKKREEKDNKSIIKERRRYERERIDEIKEKILSLLKDMIEYTFEGIASVFLGYERNIDSYEGKENEIKEAKDYISDIIEDEDMRECLILYLKHMKICYNNDFELSTVSDYSSSSLYYLLSTNEFN